MVARRALNWAWNVSSAAVGSVGTGLYNVGVGAAHTVWDVVAVPVDIVGTTLSSNWTPQSYYGESTQAAMRSGVPFWQYAGEAAVNGGTFGAWGYGKSAYNWYQSVDPTEWQQTQVALVPHLLSLPAHCGQRVFWTGDA